jgi:hypothetical protein
MNKIFYAAVFFAAITFSSCGNDADKNSTDSATVNAPDKPADSAPKHTLNSKLNYVDANGKRQGKWIIFGKMSGDAAYNPTDKVEEGNYKDGEKEGEWKEYNPDGSVKRVVYFSEGKEVK